MPPSTLPSQALFHRKRLQTIDSVRFTYTLTSSSDMPAQADMLVDRMIKALGASRFASEWKLVTFFIGGNDLCSFCKDAVCDANIAVVVTIRLGYSSRTVTALPTTETTSKLHSTFSTLRCHVLWLTSSLF